MFMVMAVVISEQFFKSVFEYLLKMNLDGHKNGHGAYMRTQGAVVRGFWVWTKLNGYEDNIRLARR